MVTNVANRIGGGMTIGELTNRIGGGMTIGELANRIGGGMTIGEAAKRIGGGMTIGELTNRIGGGMTIGEPAKRIGGGMTIGEPANRIGGGMTIGELKCVEGAATALIADRARTEPRATHETFNHDEDIWRTPHLAQRNLLKRLTHRWESITTKVLRSRPKTSR